MACEIIPYCKFIGDNLGSLPKTAEYIKQKQCLGDFESCNILKTYRNIFGNLILAHLDSHDIEELSKIIKYLLNE
jgi:hypothetical protein